MCNENYKLLLLFALPFLRNHVFHRSQDTNSLFLLHPRGFNEIRHVRQREETFVDDLMTYVLQILSLRRFGSFLLQPFPNHVQPGSIDIWYQT